MKAVHIIGIVFELVISDQCTIRFTTRSSEFILIDLLEKLALVELDGLVEVLHHVLL